MKLDLQLNELRIDDSYIVFNSVGVAIIHFNFNTCVLRVAEGIDRSRVVAFCQRHKLSVDRIEEVVVKPSYFNSLFLFNR